MKKLLTTTLCLAAAGLFLTGCEGTRGGAGPRGPVSIIKPPHLDDLMNVASQATTELLTHSSIADARTKPVMEFAPIRNATRARIQIEQVTGRIEDELINSGLVRVVHPGAVLPKPPDLFVDGTIMQQDATFTFQLRLNNSKMERIWGRSINIPVR